ncbi:MAG: hypothetical protein HYT03_02975 [Candidatus Harrisonbacteria bacterium]|nr:hypothetical protein [Candidatus Harrisonbacteria bacterium]
MKFLVIILALVVVGIGIFFGWQYIANQQANVVKSCGENNYNCLIEAAKVCGKATMASRTPFNLVDIGVETTGVIEIRGAAPEMADKCVFYTRTDNAKLIASASSQLTEAEKAATEQQLKNSLIGSEATCKFTTYQIVDLLETTKKYLAGESVDSISFGPPDCVVKLPTGAASQ